MISQPIEAANNQLCDSHARDRLEVCWGLVEATMSEGRQDDTQCYKCELYVGGGDQASFANAARGRSRMDTTHVLGFDKHHLSSLGLMEQPLF